MAAAAAAVHLGARHDVAAIARSCRPRPPSARRNSASRCRSRTSCLDLNSGCPQAAQRERAARASQFSSAQCPAARCRARAALVLLGRQLLPPFFVSFCDCERLACGHGVLSVCVNFISLERSAAATKKGRQLPVSLVETHLAEVTLATRAEPFAVTKPEAGAVTGLVVGARTKVLRVTGISLLEFALPFEVPVPAVDVLIFFAGLPSLDPSFVVAGAVCAGRILRSRRIMRSRRVRCA